MKLDSVSEDRVARALLPALSRYQSWTVLDISFVGQECPTHTLHPRWKRLTLAEAARRVKLRSSQQERRIRFTTLLQKLG